MFIDDKQKIETTSVRHGVQERVSANDRQDQ